MNDRAVLDLLLAHGPLSRTRTGQLTGLSKPTVSQLLSRLEAAGLVVATGTTEGGPGPGARLYAVNARAAYAAGLDVTPRRILAAVADLTGTVVGEYELLTPERRADSAVRQVTRALDGAVRAAGLAHADLRRVVIGTPGAFDPATGQLRYAAHLPGWHSAALLDELTAALPVPVEYENDVNLAAVAERRLGAARGKQDFVLLWNEQGLGAALFIGGQLHRGFTGGAGEVGFLPVPGTALVRKAARANSGGFQELAGAPSVPRLARALGIDVPEQHPERPHAEAAARLLARAAAGHTGAGHSGRTDDERAGRTDAGRADDEHAQDGRFAELLRLYAQRLATGLASVTAVLDPELIVLTGGVTAAGGEPLRALVERELAELAASRPRLVLGEVQRRPVLRGALESALATTRDEVFDTSSR
ncbi:MULTISPECIES: ROK family transcriptional regulator [unclassified Streptomyces]|uniref:ROK family transcriptional regulator n=1 Tax=unclassified Streptomyces TaxID=2593676 RepID=UPI002E2D0B64|nr:ROK family transcriptional regulator [Streptomyces sp. NBC_01429]